MPYYYFGNYSIMLALLAVMVLGFIAQARVQSTFRKYSQVRSLSGYTGRQIAQDILISEHSSVLVSEVRGSLTDHFDPRNQTVGLSQSVYSSDSVAALAVAAHEIGHVMQYERGYFPIRVRNAILPVARFGSSAAPFIVILGLLFGSYDIAIAGVILFGAVLAFQLITLPVEFNASRRAIETLGNYVPADELPAAKKVLNAAAMTYVVAALASAVSLLRLLTIANRRR